MFKLLIIGIALILPPTVYAKNKQQNKQQSKTLWFQKSTGAKSCEGNGQPLSEAKKELKAQGVRILQACSGDDGMMHIQVCGADTGKLHFFKIEKKSLKKCKVENCGLQPAIKNQPCK